MKQAVEKALEAFRTLYNPEEAKNPLLEAISRSEDGKLWEVTIGFNVTIKVPLTPLDHMLRDIPLPKEFEKERRELEAHKERLERKYKTFQIDAETGELIRMAMAEA